MPVIYDSNAIIPAPFITISKEFVTQEDGKIIGQTYVLSVKGKIIANMGSPGSGGVFWNQPGNPPDEVLTSDQLLASILRKQEALRKLFANEGKVFEIQPLDGSMSVKCNPRIRKPPEFEEGLWITTVPYTIVLECDTLNGLISENPTTNYVSKVSDEWNIEPGDDIARTYRLTHNVQATGKRFYDSAGTLLKPAWQNAQDYVLNTIGLGLQPNFLTASGVLNLNTFSAYNFMRHQHVNDLGGQFGVTETWLCFDASGQPPAIEDFTVNTRTQENQITDVTIEGTIKGLEVRDNNNHNLITTRLQNANSYWQNITTYLFGRCQNLSGFDLNPQPLELTSAQNYFQGIITYQQHYNNRPNSTIPGSISEVITIGYDNPNDVFANLPIVGAPLGPVLQGIGTVTARKLTLQIEAVLPASTQSHTCSKPNTDALVLTYKPIASGEIFVDRDVENLTPNQGRYSRNTSWTYKI